MILKLNVMLEAMLGSKELVRQWWESPNKAFNKLRPIDVDIEEVYAYVAGHFSR